MIQVATMRKSRVGEDWRNVLGQVPGVFFEAWDTQEMGALVISRIQVLSTSSRQGRREQLSLSWPVDSPLAAEQRRRTHWWSAVLAQEGISAALLAY